MTLIVTKSALLPILFVVALTGCAATYQGPVTPIQINSVSIPRAKTDILATARRVLVANGYQITAFDDAAGIIRRRPTI